MGETIYYYRMTHYSICNYSLLLYFCALLGKSFNTLFQFRLFQEHDFSSIICLAVYPRYIRFQKVPSIFPRSNKEKANANEGLEIYRGT